MGTWGPGIFENDAAGDWLGHLERLGFMAIPTPLAVIGEYASRSKAIPPEAEQGFWAMCGAVAIAGEEMDPDLDARQVAIIRHNSRRILAIPNLRQRILWALDQLDRAPTELARLWDDAGKGDAFRLHRDRAKAAAIKVLTPRD